MSKIMQAIIVAGNLSSPQVLRRFFRSAAFSGDRFQLKRRMLRGALAGRRGFGLNEVIGIAAGIIIAAAVVIPGLQDFAGVIMGQLESWWGEMASGIFTTAST